MGRHHCSAHGEQACAFVAVVHYLNEAYAALIQASYLIVGKRGMPSVDVDVDIGLEHDVRDYQVQAWDR